MKFDSIADSDMKASITVDEVECPAWVVLPPCTGIMPNQEK
jgi:hypothetical protein